MKNKDGLILYTHKQLRDLVNELLLENKHLKKDRDYYKDIVRSERDYQDKDDWGV